MRTNAYLLNAKLPSTCRKREVNDLLISIGITRDQYADPNDVSGFTLNCMITELEYEYV